MRINPCHGCPIREGCEVRPRILDEVRGISARSVNYDCKRLRDALSQGRRIKVKHPVADRNGYGERVTVTAQLSATIISSRKDGKFTCVVDDRQDEGVTGKHRFRRWMGAYRIVAFLDEPRRLICENGRVVTGESCDHPPDEECWCEASKRDMEFT